jgi:FKBP-type peptidyl-prolyl cis-trans isomerase (trigger factor)
LCFPSSAGGRFISIAEFPAAPSPYTQEENTKAESAAATEQRTADAFSTAVAAAVEVALPESLIQELGRNELTGELGSLVRAGQLSLEQVELLLQPQYVSQYIDKKRGELEELQRAALGFADLVVLKGLALDQAEVERELQRVMADIEAQRAAGQGYEADREVVRQDVVKTLETRAAMDWLVANCGVTVTPCTAEA